jgi:hypothetical protein
MAGMTRLEFLRQKRVLLKRLETARAAAVDAALKKAAYEASHRIEFFSPLPYQQMLIDMFLKEEKKTLLFQGGNRAGKTTLGACIVGACCLGVFPWNNQRTPWGDVPIKVRILCEDWEHHAKEVVIPKLKEWLPVGTYRTRNNNVGIEGFWDFSNGSSIEILTNSQETRLHEGWSGHLVWADEPTSRDKYVANQRGLVDYSGKFLLTMTAVKETWVLDAIVRNADPTVGCVTGIKMRDNPTLREADIKAYESNLTEDEKLTRIEGGWLNLAGLIWGNEFSNEKNIIDDFTVPRDWPVVAMIDWHTQKPHAVSYYAVNPAGVWHLVHETWLNQTAEELADDIIRCKKGDRQWRIEHAFIDPLSKGDTAYAKRLGAVVEDSFTKIYNRLRTAGILLDVASKDKASGIRNVQAMMKGLNGQPALLFLRSTVNAISKEGTVWEIQRWIYKDGEPLKENDHFCENLYRLTLTGVGYTDPRLADVLMPVEKYNPLTYGLRVSSL